VSGALLQAGRTPVLLPYALPAAGFIGISSQIHHRGEMKQERRIETVEEFKLCIAADHRWQA